MWLCVYVHIEYHIRRQALYVIPYLPHTVPKSTRHTQSHTHTQNTYTNTVLFTIYYLNKASASLGSSEIRNWLVVGEMAKDLDLEWVEYVPGYRSPALTGTGLAFAAWTTLF
jgi:hypothetical protein